MKGVGAFRLRLPLPSGAIICAQGDTRIVQGDNWIIHLVAPFVVALLMATIATGQTDRGNQKRPVVVGSRKPNVVLITIDTLRADHVGCYGAQNVKTPTLIGARFRFL